MLIIIIVLWIQQRRRIFDRCGIIVTFVGIGSGGIDKFSREATAKSRNRRLVVGCSTVFNGGGGKALN